MDKMQGEVERSISHWLQFVLFPIYLCLYGLCGLCSGFKHLSGLLSKG